MWKPKNKTTPEQGRAPGRQVNRSGGPAPAFSYYANKAADVGRDRPQVRTSGPEVERPKGAFAARLPLWLLLGLAAVCLIKVMLLGTVPKVIVVGGSSATASYAQPSEVYAAAAQKILSGSIASRSKLTVDLNGTARALEHQFPELQAVSLGMPLIGSRPIVYVQIARPSLVLQTGSTNYALNKAGIVLAKLPTITADVPLVVDQSGAKPQLGKQSLPSSTVEFLQVVAYQLRAAHLDVSVFTLPQNAPYEIDVRISGKPYYARFNARADALTQSGALIATLQHLGATVPADHIDVRVPGRVYYK